ncbi:unnamed protein product [Clonostachys rosea]|uniref:Uncharacterized protein n=1 Tax=Bionectria ochroleuca TaxID=29856 RepID=A0ABY6TYW4_BIOOC|nr:unnamed protein product [Clonostachys rosea]
MALPQYKDSPVDLSTIVDFSALSRKSVIITGGASGLGKAYAVSFVQSGSFVTIADYDEVAGKKTAAELGGSAQFVKCDVRDWSQQVAVFEAAVRNSPDRSCDIVIANAGVVGVDSLLNFQGPIHSGDDSPARALATNPMLLTEDADGSPVKPDLKIIEVNLLGSAYTSKLALHYFRRQPFAETRDRCLILKASIAAYADQPGSPQYNASKWGSRGLMRSLRRVLWKEGIGVNLVAPWYVRTPILSDKTVESLQSKGVKFATVDDCAMAMLRIATNKEINGRSFAIVPRDEAPSGAMDMAHDDYQDGDYLKDWQAVVLDTAQAVVEYA